MSGSVFCLSGAHSVGAQLPERKAECASVCTVAIKNEWKYTQILSYCVLGKVLSHCTPISSPVFEECKRSDQ
jgi:hypothetical protein